MLTFIIRPVTFQSSTSTQLASRGWVDPVPDLIHILNCGIAMNQTCGITSHPFLVFATRITTTKIPHDAGYALTPSLVFLSRIASHSIRSKHIMPSPFSDDGKLNGLR